MIGNTITVCVIVFVIEIVCPKPPLIANAYPSSFDTSYGSKITYTCIVGSAVEGGDARFLDGQTNRTITCIGLGVWGPKLSDCEGIYYHEFRGDYIYIPCITIFRFSNMLFV